MTYSDIYDIVKKIPYGKVATYKLISLLAGEPRGARAVGNALHNNPCPEEIPCHRVINSQGYVSANFAFGGPLEQVKRLQNEGINVENNKVDLKKYLWSITNEKI